MELKWHPWKPLYCQEFWSSDGFFWGGRPCLTGTQTGPSCFTTSSQVTLIFHTSGFMNHHNCHYWVKEDPGTTVEKTKLIQAHSMVTHDLQPGCGPIPYSGYNEYRLLLNSVARCLTYWLNALLPVLEACKVVSTASAIWIICHGFPPNGQFIEKAPLIWQ